MMRRGKLHVRGWWPVVSATCSTNAVNDAQNAAAAFTPDRTKYKTFGTADHVATNVNADHAESGREDYSVEPSLYLEEWALLGSISNPPNSGTTVIVSNAAGVVLTAGDKLASEDGTYIYTIVTATESTNDEWVYVVTPSGDWTLFETLYYRRDASAPTGIDFDLEQAHQIPVLMRQVGTSGTITLSNTRGHLALTALELEGTAAQRTDTRQ
jgi:hypothetical protein